eukprot:6492370-Amphidinium_carterae.2
MGQESTLAVQCLIEMESATDGLDYDLHTDEKKREAVAVPTEKNVLEYSNISPEYYYDLVDEDNVQPLDAQKVVEGVHREMKFLNEQRLGEPYPRDKVP